MAQDNKTNLVSGTNYFTEGPNHTINDLYRSEKSWYSARNAVSYSPVGDLYSISNEMSNHIVADVNEGEGQDSISKIIIGTIFISNGQWAVFSTDDTISEIGIFDEYNNKYERIIKNSKTLAFNKHNLIRGVGRVREYDQRYIYWDDQKNPSRFLNLDDWQRYTNGGYKNIDSNKTCLEWEDGEDLDPKRIMLTPITDKGLSFTLKEGSTAGEIMNGAYSVIGAYVNKNAKDRITNFFNFSNVCYIHHKMDVGGSLEITVDTVDKDYYEEFALYVLLHRDMTSVCYYAGNYSTSLKTIVLSKVDTSKEGYDYTSFLQFTQVPLKTDGIYRVGSQLLRIKPTYIPDINYQKFANKIKIHWTSVEYPMDYYRNGGTNVGYMRDEVYSFFIRWVYKNGDKSRSFHIPGRERSIYKDGGYKDIDEAFVLNSDKTILPDGGIIVQEGEMGWHESSEKYPDKNHDVWQELCGKNIRHHKMPGNNISPHHSGAENKPKINVLGVKFYGIELPDDVDKDLILGYEILRGSREGNKTILGKGIINNMRSYERHAGLDFYNPIVTQDEPEIVYYQNYPYNPTSNPDVFISKSKTTESELSKNDPRESVKNANYSYQKKQINEGEIYDIEHIHKNRFTFHSPEFVDNVNVHTRSYLSMKNMRVYGVESGKTDLKFIEAKGHPKHKLMRSNSLLTSAILGIGYAYLKTQGKKIKTIEDTKVESTNSVGSEGTTVIGTGTTSVTGLTDNLIKVGALIMSDELKSKIESLGADGAQLISAYNGIDFAELKMNLDKYINLTSSYSGDGGKTKYEIEQSEWQMIPKKLRLIVGMPLLISYWSEGVSKTLDMIYSFGKYRQYALQQVSHGFYNKFTKLSKIKEYDVEGSVYLNDSSLQSYDGELYNNVKRGTSLALKTSDVPYIKEVDEFKDKNYLIDNSQMIYSDWILNNEGGTSTKNNISSYYASMVQKLDNQYGQIDSVVQVPASGINSISNNSGVIFGGDTFIGRYTEKNSMFFFTNWLDGSMENGTEFNYYDHRALSNPRFWMDTNKFDIDTFFAGMSNLFSVNSTLSDFDPFAVSRRFTQEKVSIVFDKENTTVDNPEVVFDDLLSQLYQFKDENGKTVNVTFYPLSVLMTDRPSDDSDESKQLYLDSVQTKLDEFNSKRICGCEYYLIQNFDSDIKSLLNKTEFIYNRHNLVSPINCEFYDYSNKDDKHVLDRTFGSTKYKGFQLYLPEDKLNEETYRSGDIIYSSELDYKNNTPVFITSTVNFENKKNELVKRWGDKGKTEELWYSSSFKMTKSKYETLCDLKEDIKRCNFRYAIALALMKFAQRIVPHRSYYDDKDEVLTEGEEAATFCWSKRNFDMEALADSFTDAWYDDFLFSDHGPELLNPKDRNKHYKEIYYNNKEYVYSGPWCGFSSNIPYTTHLNMFNPLLAYFITEETDIGIHFPTEEEFCKGYFYNNDICVQGWNETTMQKWDETDRSKCYTYSGYGNGIESDSSDNDDQDIINTEYFPGDWGLTPLLIFDDFGKLTKPKNDKTYVFSVAYNISKRAFDDMKESFNAWQEYEEEENPFVEYDYFEPVYNKDNKISSYNEHLLLLNKKNVQEVMFKGYTECIETVEEDEEIENKKFTLDLRYIEGDDEITLEKNINNTTERINIFAESSLLGYDIDMLYSGSGKYKYWTIDGCLNILGWDKYKNIKGKKLDENCMFRDKHMDNNDSNKVKVIKKFRCKQLEKYMDEKGALYRKVNRMNKKQQRATNKYARKLNKYTRQYIRKMNNDEGSNFFKRLKNKLKELTPSSMYALDSLKNNKDGLMMLNNAYMYLFVSGVRDFFVETSMNIDMRDMPFNIEERYFDHIENSDIETLFDMKYIDKGNRLYLASAYIADRIFFLEGNTISYGNSHDEFYDPKNNRVYYPNRILFSMASNDTEIHDFWRTYNYIDQKNFTSEITACLQNGDDTTMILFKNSSPISINDNANAAISKEKNVDGIQSITLQDFTPMEDTNSFEYGSCQDSFSALSCPSGIYYISQNQASVFTTKVVNQYKGTIKLSNMASYTSGIDKWLKNFLPYMLIRDTEVFDECKFDLTDNPVTGIGCITSYDNLNDVLYFSKKDYRVKKEFRDKLKYYGEGLFKYENENNSVINNISLGDPIYFDDASFTISFDNKLGKEGGWMSWHDWHPDLSMNTKDGIFTTKNGQIYKHNYSASVIEKGWSPFCNFYGQDYPFEVEFAISADQTVNTLKNISYLMEVYSYSQDEYDMERYHHLNENFDYAYVYNSEQNSGMLHLNSSTKDDMTEEDPFEQILKYPYYNKTDNVIEVLYTKEEQKYNINQFFDLTKNRTEENKMFVYEPCGYIKNINPAYIDYLKEETEQKRFRHRINKVRLIRKNSGKLNFILSLTMNKNLVSPR